MTGVSNPPTVMLYYANRGHICKLRMCHKKIHDYLGG